MNKGGLSSTQLTAFHKLLATTHTLTTEVRVLALDGDVLSSLKPRATSGQVNCDADADVTRSATLEFDDPDRAIQFDSDAPTTAALYFDRMFQIREGFIIPGVGRHTVPVFTGPAVKLDRTGDVVSVEAQGKEHLSMHGRPTMVRKRGHNAVDAIHDFLADGYGESLFSFPSGNKHRLPHDAVVSWEDTHWGWAVCKRIADSIGLQLFYNGAGVATLRDKPDHRVINFHSGEGGNITSLVQVSHDKSGIYNRVRVVGSNKHHVYETDLDHTAPGHPFSPYRLRRNGIRAYYRKEISAPHLRSRAAAKRRCLEELKHVQLMTFGNTFNSVPVPHLDELDVIHTETDEYTGSDRLRQWSYALGGGEMTIGYNDLVTLPRRKNKP